MGSFSAVRSRAVELARSYAGVSADDARYGELVAPDETPARRAEMVRMSGCALTELGLWRLLVREGLVRPHVLLSRPYVTGMAPAWVLQVARDFGALREGALSVDDFLPGNAVVLEGDRPSVHVYTPVDVQPGTMPGRLAVISVDGGQHVGADGAEGDLQVVRSLLVIPSGSWDTREDPPPTLTRRVTHVVDLDAMAA